MMISKTNFIIVDVRKETDKQFCNVYCMATKRVGIHALGIRGNLCDSLHQRDTTCKPRATPSPRPLATSPDINYLLICYTSYYQLIYFLYSEGYKKRVYRLLFSR